MKIGIWYDLFFNHIFDTSYIGVKNNKYIKVDPKSEFIAPTTFKNSAKKATQWFENSSKKLCKNSNNSSVNPNSCPLQKYGKGGADWPYPESETLCNATAYPLQYQWTTNLWIRESLYVTKEVLWTFFEKWTTFIVVKLFVKKKPIFLDHPSIISWTV